MYSPFAALGGMLAVSREMTDLQDSRVNVNDCLQSSWTSGRIVGESPEVRRSE